MFKAGDLVRMRPRLSVNRMYGNITFLEKMKEYRGKVFKVEAYYKNDDTLSLCGDEYGFRFSSEMFVKESFKVGDRVRIVSDDYIRNSGNRHLSKTILGTICKISGTLCGIEFDEDIGGHTCNDSCKNGHGWNIDSEYLEKVEEEKEKKVEKVEEDSIKKLSESIEKLSKKIDKEDPFKQAMIEGIIEKGKDLATDDLKKEIKQDLDKFIKDTYGILPKKVEIVVNGDKREVNGILHKDFEKICKIVEKNVPLMLTGPAGAGKNYTLEQVAQALGLEFYFTNAITQEYKLTGFIDANGVYQETQFYKAFKDGGLFFLDEVDASVPEALIILNSAIANGYFDFPNGRVNAHKDFRVVCAGNTYGTGADMVYVGRNALDGATLDRFAVIQFDYDEEVEKELSYDDELYGFIKDLRNVINKASLRYIVSMRATINATKLLQIGIPKHDILESVIIKNMQVDDLNVIINKMSNSSEWEKELEKLVRGRNARV